MSSKTLPPTSFAVAALLTALVAFGPISTDLYLPSLPGIMRDFDTDVAMAQLTLSLFVGGFALSQLLYGPLSDRFGRRPMLLIGVAIYAAASLLCLFAPTIEILLLGRLLQAVGACCGPVIGRAIVRDVYPRDQAARVLAYMATAMAVAPAVAPMIGGLLLDHFGWRANFALLFGFGALLLAATALMLRETNGNLHRDALRPSHMAAAYLGLLRDKVFIGYVLTLGFAFAALFSFISGSSFVVIEILGVAPAQFGFAFAAVVAGYMSGTFTAGRLSHKIGTHRMIGLGCALLAAAGAVLAGLAWAGVQTIAAVIAPICLLFLATGLIMPNATAAAIAPYARMAGSASALMGFLQMSIGAVAGVLVGRLHDGTTRPMTTIMLAAGLLAAASFFGLVARRKPS